MRYRLPGPITDNPNPKKHLLLPTFVSRPVSTRNGAALQLVVVVAAASQMGYLECLECLECLLRSPYSTYSVLLVFGDRLASSQKRPSSIDGVSWRNANVEKYVGSMPQLSVVL